jgi:hypothetical protein
MSDGEYDPRDGGEPSSSFAEAFIGGGLRVAAWMLGELLIVCFEKVEPPSQYAW